MTKKQRAAIIIERLREAYPDATCTLEYDEAWKLLVEVRLAAQCTDARVNIVVQDLYAKYPTVAALAEAKPEDTVLVCGSFHTVAHVMEVIDVGRSGGE